MRNILKSKIDLTVTKSSIDYDGSITLCPRLMKAANLQQYENVHVNNATNGKRIETYVLTGKKGDVQINGAASHHFAIGDRIHVNAFEYVGFDQDGYKPFIVHTDDLNRIID